MLPLAFGPHEAAAAFFFFLVVVDRDGNAPRAAYVGPRVRELEFLTTSEERSHQQKQDIVKHATAAYLCHLVEGVASLLLCLDPQVLCKA